MTLESTIPILFNHYQRLIVVHEKVDDRYILRRSPKIHIHQNDVLREIRKRKRALGLYHFFRKYLRFFHYHNRLNHRVYVEILFPDGQHFMVNLPGLLYDLLPEINQRVCKFPSTTDASGFIIYFFLYHNRLLSEANQKMYRKVFYTCLNKN